MICNKKREAVNLSLIIYFLASIPSTIPGIQVPPDTAIRISMIHGVCFDSTSFIIQAQAMLLNINNTAAIISPSLDNNLC